MRRSLYLYGRFTVQNIRALMEYKNDLIISTIAGAIWQGVGLIFLVGLFGNIHSVGGWTVYEVALLYGCIMFGEGVYTLGFQGITSLGYLINVGEFDRLLLRPAGLITQIVGHQFNFAGLFTMLNASAVIAYSLVKLGAAVSAGGILLFLLNILIGVYIRVNLQLIFSSFSFIFKTAGSLGTLFYNTQVFGKYPMSIYPRVLQLIFYTIIPHAIISYVPVSILIGRMEVWPWEAAMPLSALFMTLLQHCFFGWAIKKYESAGN